MPLLFENHPMDCRVTGPKEICPALNERMGTGGGQCADSPQYWMTDKAGHLCRFTSISKCNTLQATDYKDPPVILTRSSA